MPPVLYENRSVGTQNAKSRWLPFTSHQSYNLSAVRRIWKINNRLQLPREKWSDKPQIGATGNKVAYNSRWKLSPSGLTSFLFTNIQEVYQTLFSKGKQFGLEWGSIHLVKIHSMLITCTHPDSYDSYVQLKLGADRAAINTLACVWPQTQGS